MLHARMSCASIAKHSGMLLSCQNLDLSTDAMLSTPKFVLQCYSGGVRSNMQNNNRIIEHE